MSHQDTIFALSSGSLPSGVAVIRISGPLTFVTCAALFGELPPEREFALKSIHARNGLVLDRGLVAVFPGPRSFTGEDCAELHLHGSKAVIAAVLQELQCFDGCRLAEAGEFSRRAFENGKLDLVEIEGLADLLVAETEMQRRLAIEQSFGHLSKLFDAWRERLLTARALIEAELDFADESDVPGAVSDQVWSSLTVLRDEVARNLEDEKRGEIIRDGFKVVIAGPPNAGKSSLMNALARRDIAIVTEYAGTTRDIIQCDLDIEGYAVKLYDTAGIRDTGDIVEREGIRRAHQKIDEADLVLLLSDLSAGALGTQNISGPTLKIGTKSDLVRQDQSDHYDLQISTRNDADIDAVRNAILSAVKASVEGFSLAIPSRIRQRQFLATALAEIDLALDMRLGLELRAEHLRQAADSLGRVVGRVDIETLLGKIFSEFCIGK
ncbi:tRNA uridine-5-carboxymethylaminomethyl(34) synthesis GTPase MnmE [Rhizobium sp. CG5]|uniref:tRNA uridine-5-carboxymethylaminomethyl(34) synthesis GTPase MnmE n=1 Tax=Rhizobium sp. CG5 TaxID=2726076 RepID=UPI00203341B6|nr:tRNA uridine-5-carboxymethylaminomethyl(34) synthesis GTPase MnmE [Rhizobium sp. CG5]MCM2476671.1 tRNA uridine-5-carboxymethylaminomethyl(34) synthesis GTPase MnmE [Rhizobium sp. CG5]